MSRAYIKPTPKIVADALYDRHDFERAFSREQRLEMKRAGLKPLKITHNGNEPIHFDGADILATMRRIARERQGETSSSPPDQPT